MATIAFDSPYEDEAAKPPISLHPAFPAIVALWFAALLGIGSLVLPAVLLDRMVTATGLASLIPGASPPLGMTARGLIALAGALVGAGLGVTIARRVAQSHAPKEESRVAKLATGSRRPLSIKDELGGANGLGGVTNGEGFPITRRRALAISEDNRPSDFLYQIPLPGGDPDGPAPFAAAAIVDAPLDTLGADDEPLELSELAEHDNATFAAGAAEPEDEADLDETRGDFEMTDSRESRSAWPSHQHFPAAESEPVDEMDSRDNLGGPRGLEPLPFSAPSLARKAPTVEFEPEPEIEPEPETHLEAVAAPVAGAEDGPEFCADWETAPLDGLGLVQLVQRLGSTIERRRERLAQEPAPVAAPAAPFAAPPVDFEPAPAEEAAQAMAAFFAPNPEPEADEAGATESTFDPAPVEVEAEPEAEPVAMARPGFLSSFAAATDDDDEEDSVPDFSLPLRRTVATDPAFTPADNDAAEEAAEAEEEAGEESEAGYSSLLGMNNPFVAPKA